MERSEENRGNTQVQVTINRPITILHFSDGVEEEIEEENVNNVQNVQKTHENVNAVSNA